VNLSFGFGDSENDLLGSVMKQRSRANDWGDNMLSFQDWPFFVL
jgi:hypothetical protein